VRSWQFHSLACMHTNSRTDKRSLRMNKMPFASMLLAAPEFNRANCMHLLHTMQASARIHLETACNCLNKRAAQIPMQQSARTEHQAGRMRAFQGISQPQWHPHMIHLGSKLHNRGLDRVVRGELYAEVEGSVLIRSVFRPLDRCFPSG